MVPIVSIEETEKCFIFSQEPLYIYVYWTTEPYCSNSVVKFMGSIRIFQMIKKYRGRRWVHFIDKRKRR